MTYLYVEWKHSNPQYPICIISELDENRWEVRKVELFADGSASVASEDESAGTTKLALEPIPSIEEIASDAQFAPREITQMEFEEVWKRFA